MKYRSHPLKVLGLALLVVSLSVVAALSLKPGHKAQQQTASSETSPAKTNGPVMAAPAINWVRQPQLGDRGRLNMAFKVESSTPLRTLQVQVTPIVKLPGLDTDKDSRDVPTWLLGQKTINWDGELDLTSSPLAGTPVTVQVVAIDDDNRTSTSDAVSLTLPERAFTHPLAKALYTLRKALREDPDKRNEALRALAAILQQRQHFEGGNDLTLLTLRSAAVRIALDRTDEGLRSALDLMWHAAVLFEQDQVRVADKLPADKSDKKN